MSEPPHKSRQAPPLTPSPPPNSEALPPIPAKSGLWGWVVGALLLLTAVLAVFWQFHTQLNTLEARLVMDASGGERLKAMNQQMALLRDRLHSVMADSVEIRMKALERSIASGKVGGDDLILFRTLQNDLQSLEGYAAATGNPLPDSAAREHPRYQAAGMAAAGALAHSEMLQEIARLRTLLYLCLTGLLGAGGVAATRYWLGSRQPPALDRPSGHHPPRLTRRRSSGPG